MTQMKQIVTDFFYLRSSFKSASSACQIKNLKLKIKNRMTKYIKIIFAACIVLAAATTSCKKDKDTDKDVKDTDKDVAVTSVTITAPAGGATLTVGDDPLTLTAVVTPDDATDKSVTWTSGNTAFATVGEKTGTVTAVAPGSCKITATAKNGKSDNITVTVIAVVPPTVAITASSSDLQSYFDSGQGGNITMTADVTSAGTSAVTERGMDVEEIWAGSPSVRSYQAALGTGTGSFTMNDIYSTQGAASRFRAYATNAEGTGYSEWVAIPSEANADGSPEYPFIVNSAATLQKVGTGTDGWTAAMHYRQDGNIDMSGIAHIPRNINGGSYNGYGFAISNLTCSNRGMAGLFDIVQSGGVVENVRLTNVSITGNPVAGSCVGGIAARIYDNSTVQNCYVLSGSVASNSDDASRVGGVVGESRGGTVRNCYAACSVSGYRYVGGIVGFNSNLNGTPWYGLVENCYATGNVTGIGAGTKRTDLGGVAGINGTGCTLRNCYATGDVDGYDDIGGVVGYNSGTLQNCYATGDVSGYDHIGGVVGFDFSLSGTIENCVALNKNVTAAKLSGAIYIARITCATDGAFSGNYARETGMIIKYGSVTYLPVPSLTGQDGADVPATDYNGANSDTWWSDTALFSGTAWSFDKDRLPHLQGFSGVTQNPTVQ